MADEEEIEDIEEEEEEKSPLKKNQIKNQSHALKKMESKVIV